MTFPNPLPAHRFIVTLDPADAYLPPAQSALIFLVAAGQFQEAKGLGGELEVLKYAEGGQNDYFHQLPMHHSWTNIVLKRGIVQDAGLWFWYVAGQTASIGARRDGAIILLTPLGVPAIAWEFRAGLAVKWAGPELNAMENRVAVESIEIAHEGLTQIPLSPPGTP
jgi:phage tail-like protein